jgi:hypothetical protein
MILPYWPAARITAQKRRDAHDAEQQWLDTDARQSRVLPGFPELPGASLAARGQQ